MPEMQDLEKQEAIAELKPTVRLYEAEGKTRTRWKKIADKTADVVITTGGVAIILSVLAILFVILAESLPLWKDPVTEQRPTLSLQQIETAAPPPLTGTSSGVPGELESPIGLGVDEYQSIAYVVTKTGALIFLSLEENRILQRYEIKGLEGKPATAVYEDDLHHVVSVGSSTGTIISLTITFGTKFENNTRTVVPSVKERPPLQIDPEGRPIVKLVYTEEEGKIGAAALLGPRALLFYARRETTSLLGASSVEEYRADLSPALKADVTALALDKFQFNLLAGTATGEVYHWEVDEPENPVLADTFAPGLAKGAGISALGWILGDRSIIVGDTAGDVSVWFQVRKTQDSQEAPYQQIHELRSHDAPVTAIARSQRDKGFVTADAAGSILLHHSTSDQTLLELRAGAAALPLLVFAPKANGIYAVDAQSQLLRWSLFNPHPEISLKALFGKVWYEGYEEPDYTWQSSSGSDEFEPKFSLTPLAYGTLKGTFYALLLAVPLSLCAALYTSQFLHPSLRNLIKPTVEVMAALPSVVLGFFAGLWLAPIIEKIVPAVFLMLLMLPLVTLIASFFWRLIPLEARSRFKPGMELFFLAPLLVLTVYTCISLNGWLEAAFFAGNFPQWLYDSTGMRYDPRNSLVVGFAMGFAVIPIIYTICEDAFSNVPQHLVSGSLALGATRWQTALRVVVPTASPGVFSAVMIGFGRAVGETMIVLMATGNTPVMDMSPFNGFRALSANIAVEIPEAPHGSTLYRVLFLAALLLFVMTFLVNTAAEIVRQRLRERYSKI
jgi:phosphate transport system permease protein